MHSHLKLRILDEYPYMNPLVIPKLYWRWWSLILQHTENVWHQLPPEVSRMITEYIRMEDPKFIKQKHIPLIITQPGKYILTQNIKWVSNDSDSSAITVSKECTIFGNSYQIKCNTICIKINKNVITQIGYVHFRGMGTGTAIKRL